MKKLILHTLIPLIILSCTSSTKITGSWKNPKHSGKVYKSFFVAALTGNTVVRSALENNFEKALGGHAEKINKSVDAFQPTFLKDTVNRREIIKLVKKNGNDVILTIALVKMATESRYVGGVYAPAGTWGYYGTFYGYYNYWYPYAYSDGYYTTDDIYYFETNLYDVSSEALIWSAQSKTWNYDYVNDFSKEFSVMVVERMKKDGVIM